MTMNKTPQRLLFWDGKCISDMSIVELRHAFQDLHTHLKAMHMAACSLQANTQAVVRKAYEPDEKSD